MSRSRLVFMVFYLTAVLIAIVHVRTSSTRMFNRYRIAQVEQKSLLRQLHQKQLVLERLVNPSAVSEQAPRGDDSSDRSRP